MQFNSVLCVDGSSGSPKKRPIYFAGRTDGPAICRYRHKDGILSICTSTDLPPPILLLVDVPIGLPLGFPQVLGDHSDFLSWLADRRGAWESLVTNSIGSQTAHSPFVVCKAGEKKASGFFPLRECDRLTGGESLFWCVGGKQVGKASLQFWHETLIPLQRHFTDHLGVWPFEPPEDRTVVVAECYPAILQKPVWGRRVTKTDPLDVVDAMHSAVDRHRSQCDETTWLHGASSEDEFDMLTTALAVVQNQFQSSALLAAPSHAAPIEGWMMLLSAAAVEPAATPVI